MLNFSGWIVRPFKPGRPLSDKETRADLRAEGLPRLEPLNKGAILLSSRCLEYLDKSFLLRGWGLLIGGALTLFSATLGTLCIHGLLNSPNENTSEVLWGAAIMGLMCGLPALFAIKLIVLKDLFGYTHHPVRFNRDTRTVYAFVKRNVHIEVPFDDAFFFIHEDVVPGAGGQRTYELRMHILENGKIIHTASIGSDGGSSPGLVLAHWEMIRRFMDEGMDALPFPPLGIIASSSVSLKNAFVVPFAGFGGGVLSLLLSPLLISVSVARYIALRTSRRPTWPRAVEDACRPAAGSRVLREPRVYGGLPGGARAESGFVAYWNKAEEQARQADASLLPLFR